MSFVSRIGLPQSITIFLFQHQSDYEYHVVGRLVRSLCLDTIHTIESYHTTIPPEHQVLPPPSLVASCLLIESMSPQTPRVTNAPRLPALISYRHGIHHRLVSIGGDQWAMYDPVRRESRLKRMDARKAFAAEQEAVKGEKWLPRNSRRIAKVSCGMLVRGKNGAGRKWLWPEVTADTVKFRFQVHHELRLLLAQGSEILSEESS